ncbi:hypothetical protein V5799_020278 [Amblyomma americanum]|uniref:Uncharacterized protein n=1 Tax=Amblyomma americanum TaxID=6943 RepID=A0AAQ4EUH8_AMBAM
MAPLDPHNHYVFNILLVGDVGVGKSSLLNALLAEKKSSDKTTAGRPTGVETNGLQYTTGGRESDEREEEGKKSEGVGKGGGYRKTGVNFKLKTIQLDGQTVKLQIWTTSDDLGFLKITSKYSKEEHGVIIMYDITDQESTRAPPCGYKGKLCSFDRNFTGILQKRISVVAAS